MSKITIYFPPVCLDDLAEVRRLVESTAVSLVGQCEAVTELVIAINEAVTNVLVHGYRGRPGYIEIEISCTDATLTVCLQDRARVFDPTAVPAPDITLPLDQRQPGGLGVYMMRQFTHQMQYRVCPAGGNELTLIKQMEL